MNEKDSYNLEFARDTEDGDRTPEQRALIKRSDIGGQLETERSLAVSERRASGVDDRLVRSYQLFEGSRDTNGGETWTSDVAAVNIGSRAYTNICRQITNDGAHQIGDLLFPNDDRNYGLKPIGIAAPPLAIEAEPATDSKGKQLVDQEGNPVTNIQAHTRRVKRAAKKTKRMFTQLDAALVAARYPSKARECIKHGAIYGAGILKGPLPTKSRKGRWAKKGGGYALNKDIPMYPNVTVVNPMDFYPDATAITIEDCRYTWERIPMQPQDLERAIDELKYNSDAVRRVLGGMPVQGSTDGSDAVDEAKAPVNSEGRVTGRYLCWERHGVMKREDLEALDVKVPKGDRTYFNSIITMCEKEILKAVIVEYESDDSLYSVYCWDEDPLNIFGYGIPWLMQDQQASYVASWRMALDNGGLSAAPQVLIDRSMITPVDGKWQMHGGKEWYIKENNYEVGSQSPPFQVVEIKQNLAEIFVMMDRSVADAYDVTGVTRVDNQGGLNNTPVTLGATQILQNNSTVSRRGQARRWDDRITLGLVTRFYDYFMQFDENEDNKANMEVEPRGATVLLAKELTATNTIQLFQMTGGGEAAGAKGIEILRGLEAAMQIPAGTYVESLEEQAAREQSEQEAAEAGDVPDPMVAIEERKIEVLEAEVELKMARDKFNEMVEMNKAEMDAQRFQLEDALAMNMSDQQTQARLDGYNTKMSELEAKRVASMEALQTTNQTQRDIAAAKVGGDGSTKRRESDIKEREIANKEREMSYKERTGNQGI
jgi:hypothetical protein|tara:strand:+ start:4722 stop:7028 length:2307 start_codon:yes stop_codon:yes gene_type:complete